MLKCPILVLFLEFLVERLVLIFFFLDRNLLPQRLGWGENFGIIPVGLVLMFSLGWNELLLGVLFGIWELSLPFPGLGTGLEWLEGYSIPAKWPFP